MSIKQTNPLEGSKRSGFVRLVGIILTIAMLIGIISSVGVITGIAATTETFTDENGISWTVTECYPGWAIKPANASQMVGNIKIPATYNNKVIFVIDSKAFSSCKELRNIKIPSSIVSIGDNAFYNCSNLVDLSLPNSIIDIGESSFEYCSSLNEIVIPNSVRNVGDWAFASCDNLTFAKLSEKMSRIPIKMFQSDSKLKNVIIPNSITEIDENAFAFCSSITSINLPNKLERISHDAFGWTGISEIDLPNSVKELSGFNNTSISSINIPSSVETIGVRAFSGCNNLINVEIPNSVKTIENSVFSNCTNLESLTIPESVVSVSDYFIQNCKKLSCLNINGNPVFDDQAFNGAPSQYYLSKYMQTYQPTIDGVTWVIYGPKNSNDNYIIYPKYNAVGEVTVPKEYQGKKIRKIKPMAFANNRSVTSVNIPDSITYIGGYAFTGCLSLTTINFYQTGESVDTVIGNYGLSTNSKSLTKVNLDNSIIELGYGAFEGCRGITEITLPDSIKSIGERAFSGTSISQITLPSSLEFLSGFGNTNISSIIIPSTVKEIGTEAFRNCSISEITIPDSVEIIGDSAFRGCSISNISLLNNIKEVKNYAFADNKVIVESLNIDNESMSQINSFAFYNNEIKCIDIGTNFKTIDTPLMSCNVNMNELCLNNAINVPYLYAFYGDDNLTVYSPVKNVTTGLLSSTKFSNVPLIVTDGIIESGGSKDAIVTLDTETPNLRVTVPSVLPISVDSDNNVTVADNAQINNMCRGQVDITSAELNTSTWSLVDFDTDFKTVPVDTKQYGFKLYNDDASDGIDANIFSTINGGESLLLSYDGNVAIQSEAKTAEEIGNIVFTVAWHKG